jgi:hypothetical protein
MNIHHNIVVHITSFIRHYIPSEYEEPLRPTANGDLMFLLAKFLSVQCHPYGTLHGCIFIII